MSCARRPPSRAFVLSGLSSVRIFKPTIEPHLSNSNEKSLSFVNRVRVLLCARDVARLVLSFWSTCHSRSRFEGKMREEGGRREGEGFPKHDGTKIGRARSVPCYKKCKRQAEMDRNFEHYELSIRGWVEITSNTIHANVFLILSVKMGTSSIQSCCVRKALGHLGLGRYVNQLLHILPTFEIGKRCTLKKRGCPPQEKKKQK